MPSTLSRVDVTRALTYIMWMSHSLCGPDKVSTKNVNLFIAGNRVSISLPTYRLHVSPCIAYIPVRVAPKAFSDKIA